MSNNKHSNPPMRRGPMGHGGPSLEKAKDFKGSIKQLIEYMKPYHTKIAIVMLFAVIGTVFTVVGPRILGKATTELANGFIAKIQGTGGINFEYILRIILSLLALYITSAAFSFAQHYIMSGVTQKTAYSLRQQIAEKINKMPFSYFDSTPHGDVLSRVTNDIDTLAQSLNQSMNTLITSIVNIIGMLIMMLTISIPMTLVALITVPISLFLVTQVVKHSQRYFRYQQKYLGQVNGHIEEMFGGHTVIKAYNKEEQSIDDFKNYNNKLYKVAWKSQFLSGLMQPITAFVGNLGYVGVCITGGYFAIRNIIEIGDIQAFIQYVRNFNQPITQIAQVMNLLQSTAAAAERVFEFLGEEEEVKDTENPVKIYDEKGNCNIKGYVKFENVKFGYKKDKIIIKNLSAEIKPGQKIAIVGPTGAGKTTIIKLLMRFYELNAGTIYIDDIDITKMTKKDLHSLFGIVLQDAWLFNGTIMENLRYGKLDATDDEIIKTAKEAYVDHFIRTLDQGYQTEINEDSNNISQGQKQLLTIARAFLTNPKILVLDEATSSVDTRTEILIQKGMEKLMENRTSFIIAHRLSTIRDADLILVMKDGDIIEIGNHDQLIEQHGFYYNLYNSQFDRE